MRSQSKPQPGSAHDGFFAQPELGEELPDNLQPHPLAKKFPPLTNQEFDDLVEDIGANGQQHAIVLYDGQILDGVHRHKACLRAGIKPRGKPYGGLKPAAYVCSANLHRRHANLTTAEKRELIAQVLKESPELSNLQVSKLTKTSDKTVASERAALESRSEIRTSDTRTDTRGRRQPRSRPAPGARGGAGRPRSPRAGTRRPAVAQLNSLAYSAASPKDRQGFFFNIGFAAWWGDAPADFRERARSAGNTTEVDVSTPPASAGEEDQAAADPMVIPDRADRWPRSTSAGPAKQAEQQRRAKKRRRAAAIAPQEAEDAARSQSNRHRRRAPR
jgi:hypothetical protein